MPWWMWALLVIITGGGFLTALIALRTVHSGLAVGVIAVVTYLLDAVVIYIADTTRTGRAV
jgi:hypothetical protein